MAIRKRILVVEDEILISMMLEESLEALGHDLVGTETSVEGALAKIASQELDGAVVDRWLRGDQKSDAVARLLKERGIPFIVATGDTLALDDAFKDGVILRKPFSIDELEVALQKMDGVAVN